MSTFTFNTTKSIIFGAGLLKQIGDVCVNELGDDILLVTDKGMIETGIVDRSLDLLAASSVHVDLFDEVTADPPEHIVLECAKAARGKKAIIGLGGGSSLDVAKLAALLATGHQELSSAYGIDNAKGPRLPLMAIPTTAGTGSEVTPISIVTTGENEKMGVVSPVILPDIAFLDPELTLGLPPHITAATGIDAMVHAIEAYASKSANNNPISRNLAQEALNIMGRSLEKAVHDGQNIEARTDMLLGSMMAGQAFANSPVAAVHALAYPLGGHFHIPHGLSNALVLPHVLRFNVEISPEPYSDLAEFVFPDLRNIEPGKKRAAAFCDELASLSVRCGLQQKLRDMNISKDFLPKLAADAMNQQRLLINNPREVTESDALEIYKNAY